MRRVISPGASSRMRPGDTRMLSLKTMMRRTIPATGSAAVMPGREVCSGAMLKALCMSHRPTGVTAISE
jgi:hypothetical protein